MGSQQYVDPYSFYGSYRKSSFRSVYDHKIASDKGIFNIYHVLFERRDLNGLSIRTVCTDRKLRLRSVYGP